MFGGTRSMKTKRTFSRFLVADTRNSQHFEIGDVTKILVEISPQRRATQQLRFCSELCPTDLPQLLQRITVYYALGVRKLGSTRRRRKLTSPNLDPTTSEASKALQRKTPEQGVAAPQKTSTPQRITVEFYSALHDKSRAPAN